MTVSATVSSPGDPPQATRRWATALAVACLLSLFAGQAVLSMRQKSVTVDEIMYIAAGFYHLETGDFRMNMTNTPMMKMLVAWPLRFIGAELPEISGNPEGWSLIEQWQYSRRFLYDNAVDAYRILFTARLPVVFLAVVLGLYVFRWSRELYGFRAGLFSLFLFSFSPNLLAHSRLATHDLGLIAFMFVATFYFWRYMNDASLRSLVLCGMFSGCALLTKTTAIFLGPVFGAFVVICVLRENGLGIDRRVPWVSGEDERVQRRDQVITAVFSFGLIGLVTLFVLNLGYAFQGAFRPLPVPAPFLTMLKNQAGTVTTLGNVYFAGKLYPDGLWHLTFTSFLLKTPVALLLLLAVALFGAARRWRTLQGEWLMLAFIGTLFFVFTFVVKSGTGLRYVLPIYPFLHVLAGSVLGAEWKRPRLAGGLVAACFAAYLFSSVTIYPHYLAYFNVLAGGPANGYKVLADSNLDWGQDLKGLAAYLKTHEIDQVHLGYFGSADASYYGIHYRYLPSVGLQPLEPGQRWWYEITEPEPLIEPEAGVYAISSTLIASPAWMKSRFHKAYSWFRGREPDDLIGYSILIFRVTEVQLRNRFQGLTDRSKAGFD